MAVGSGTLVLVALHDLIVDIELRSFFTVVNRARVFLSKSSHQSIRVMVGLKDLGSFG